MARAPRLKETIPSIEDHYYQFPEDSLDGIETVPDLLTASTSLDWFCGGHSFDAFQALADTYIDPEQVPDIMAEEIPFLKLLSFRGGRGVTYDGETINTLTDPVPPADLAGCRDAYNVLALEYTDYTQGTQRLLEAPTTPTSVFLTDDRYNMYEAYVFTTAETPSELSRPWTQTTFVRRGVVDTLASLVDVGYLRSSLEAFEFDDRGLLRIQGPEGTYAAIAAPLKFDTQSSDNLDRVV